MLQALEISNLLKENIQSQIVITTHHKPDADALGSSLGFYHFLKNSGYTNVTVISPTDYPEFLKWMPDEESVLNFEVEKEKCIEITQNAKIIFCLDFNALKRINEYGIVVGDSEAIKIIIDHHQHPDDFSTYTYWDGTASSTCELIYRLIKDIKQTDNVDEKVANCLYAGMMTDTGSFRFDNVGAETFRVAGDLIEKGAKNYAIADKILDSSSFERMQFIGYALYKKLEILPDLPVAIMHISRDELYRFKSQTGDTEGLVNFGLSIKGIELSVLIIDRTKAVKLSFRAKGKFPCHIYSKEQFNGGGHVNASGGESDLNLEDTVKKFKETIYDYKDYLLK